MDGLKQWLTNLSKPVGIMACNDSRGRQVLEACRQLGLNVPDDVAVIGVDNDELMCELSAPPLSSILQGTEQIGFEAAKLLDQMMRRRRRSTHIMIPPACLVARQSTDLVAIDDAVVSEALRYIRKHATERIGVIDGNKVFDPKGEARMRGPHTILLSDCHDVTLEGVTMRDSANYAFFFYASTKVRVRDATFEGGWDGVHFRGSLDRWNRDVRITNCRFFTGDDCIAGHYIKDGVVENCLLNSSCNGVRLIGPAQGLSFTRCKFLGPGKFEHRTPANLRRTNMLAAIILQPSAWTPTPGPLEDVHLRDITIHNVACALHVSIREGNTADRLIFERLTATDVYSSAVSLESWADKPIGEVTVRQMKVKYTLDAVIDPRLGKKPVVQDPIRKPGVGVWARRLPVWGVYGRNIHRLHLDKVTLEKGNSDDARPVILTDSVEQLIVGDLHHSPLPPTAKAIQRRNN